MTKRKGKSQYSSKVTRLGTYLLPFLAQSVDTALNWGELTQVS
ncbi:hypothetical protein GCM10009114_29240 [Aliiglaciecola litoralis]|uniref:Uncharacterized protein n=1 Tax=Aliiglaciecola litoralis TaxID=582857 RepID=A0ABP3X0Y2_9ALTE